MGVPECGAALGPMVMEYGMSDKPLTQRDKLLRRLLFFKEESLRDGLDIRPSETSLYGVWSMDYGVCGSRGVGFGYLRGRKESRRFSGTYFQILILNFFR